MKKLLIANWKLNKNLSEITAWFDEFSKELLLDNKDAYFAKDIEFVICPSTPYLPIASEIASKYNLDTLSVGAQDVSEFVSGSHTGEVSASQLKDFCNYAIVGHSERGETMDVIFKKVKNCLDFGITPIVCLKDVEGFGRFLESGFPLDKVLLVWEDPSNISTDAGYNVTAPEQVKDYVKKIRELVGDINLIYGGSVNKDNITFLTNLNFFGFLVGHASLEVKSFAALSNEFLSV